MNTRAFKAGQCIANLAMAVLRNPMVAFTEEDSVFTIPAAQLP